MKTSRMGKPSIAVITATIGHRFLGRAIDSVRAQNCGASLTHWIVIDGPQWMPAVEKDLSGANLRVLALPQRTGHNGWCSHRIYAATPFLVDAEYICYLDQDNWFETDHVLSLLETALDAGQPCAHSLRAVSDREGKFVCADDCQSLGNLHDCYDEPGVRHVDTNCWLLRRDLAMMMAPHWNTPYVGDRRFAREVMAACPRLPCTRRYSVNYSVDSRAESAPAQYFLRGNAVMARRYPSGLPWRGDAQGKDPTRVR